MLLGLHPSAFLHWDMQMPPPQPPPASPPPALLSGDASYDYYIVSVLKASPFADTDTPPLTFISFIPLMIQTWAVMCYSERRILWI